MDAIIKLMGPSGNTIDIYPGDQIIVLRQTAGTHDLISYEDIVDMLKFKENKIQNNDPGA